MPGGTTTRPSGFCRSLATFATYLLAATPTDTVSWVAARTSCLSRCAIARPSPNNARLPVTSRNASSSDNGSTWSVKRANTACTCAATAAYTSMRGGTKMPCGQRRRACTPGIAECTPNLRAS